LWASLLLPDLIRVYEAVHAQPSMVFIGLREYRGRRQLGCIVLSVLVSFIAVRRLPARIGTCRPASASTRRTGTDSLQQTWKADWGRPLKGSNP
jgi:hypothetical protein